MLLFQCKPINTIERNFLVNSTPFGVCYAKVTPQQVSGYEMVVIEPDFFSKPEMDALKATGTKIIAYTTLGEIDPNRWYFPMMEARGFIGINQNWGSSYVDLSDSVNRSIILDKVIPEIIVKGVDGIFLDTIDAVAPYTERSNLEPYMVELIKEIRIRYPELIIIQNAGLFLLDETNSFVDAVLVESIASGYDFENQEYLIRDLAAFNSRLEMLQNVADEYDLPVFVIDFSNSNEGISEIKQRLDSLGYPYFISNINLTELPEDPKLVSNKVER